MLKHSTKNFETFWPFPAIGHNKWGKMKIAILATFLGKNW